MKQLRRILIIILIFAFTLGVMPAYAETATATTLRLAGSSGTVSITNANGKEQTVKTDMRLYSGYSLTTGKQSSAYISLDGTKAVKLDSSSKSSVRKAGNKLEVCLDSGKLFFDVTAPLAADESLNIRTSTMVTGIRGSFGWVARNEVALLHGHVTLTCINPVTGEVRVTELFSGERVYYDPSSTVSGDPNLKEIDFIKEIITNDDIPAFVVEEIRKDESLQEALIEDVPSIDVPKLLEDYEDIKAAEDEEIEKREQELNEELKEQEEFIEKDPVDYLFDDEGGIATYSVHVLLPGSLVLTGALTSGDAITPTTNADGSQTCEVPEGDSLTFTLDTTGFYVDTAAQVTLDGTALAAPYEVTAAGTVRAKNVYYAIDSTTIDTLFDSLDAYGAVVFDDAAVGTLTVSGNVKADQTLLITAGSTFTIGAGASLTIDEDGDLINKGTISNNGTFVNNSSHTFYNNAGALFSNWSAATNNGRIINDGEINNDGNMTFAAGSVLENGDTLQNNGGGGHTLTVEAGATVNNSGTIQNFDDLRNDGTINNTGIFNNTAGTFTNNGTLTAGGTAANGGTVTGQSGGITGTLYNGELTVTGTGAIEDGGVWGAFASSVVILTIDDGITSIGDGAFQNYSSMEAVTIPGTVTAIGDDAFAGCTSLVSATFEGAMPDMGENIFEGVDGEFTLYYDYDQDGWYDELGDDNTIGGYNAVSCARGTCGDDLYYTIYTAGKFDEDAGDENEFILDGVGDSVSAYRPTAEEDGEEEEEDALVWLEITGTGPMYDFDNYSDAPWYGQKITQVLLPEKLASIGDYAFYDCGFLESVVIPDGVTYIGEYAFYGCKAMTTAILPNNLTYLGDNAFYGCEALIGAAVPAGVTVLYEGVFGNCSGLVSVVLQGEVTSIGKNAFYRCSSLAHFDIPSTVTSIGDSAFMYCSGLEELELPEGLQSLGNSAFMGCSSIKSVTLPENITDVPWQTFRECGSLTEVTFKGPITGIGNSAFAYCDKLPQLTIPDTVTSIGSEAFREAGLTSLVLPDSVTSLGTKAFVKCTVMKSITLSSSLTSLPDGLFDCCYELEAIVVPDSVTIIGSSSINGTTFASCRSLKELTLPAGLTRLGGPYTFQYCFTDDATVYFKGTQAQWDSLKSALPTKGNERINSVNVVCLGG